MNVHFAELGCREHIVKTWGAGLLYATFIHVVKQSASTDSDNSAMPKVMDIAFQFQTEWAELWSGRMFSPSFQSTHNTRTWRESLVSWSRRPIVTAPDMIIVTTSKWKPVPRLQACSLVCCHSTCVVAGLFRENKANTTAAEVQRDNQPGHQQTQWWLCRINAPLFSKSKEFKYFCHLSGHQ